MGCGAGKPATLENKSGLKVGKRGYGGGTDMGGFGCRLITDRERPGVCGFWGIVVISARELYQNSRPRPPSKV